MPPRVGSIPAWAGKPPAKGSRCSPTKVYPRVGGETSDLISHGRRIHGLSPRGRGNRLGQVHIDRRHGSIPAWAGKPRSTLLLGDALPVYPRVGGETRGTMPACAACTGLSPRGRGNRREPRIADGRARSIPAWAGKPGSDATRRPGSTVYPRVGGETRREPSLSTRPDGLSPRGRGNLL